jgi:glycine betaine catabolism A
MTGMALEASLPRSAYVDDKIWQRERDRILGATWVCVGRSSDIGAAGGSYRLVNVASESLLLVRADDGRINGFVNLCAHRGAELVDSTDGDCATGCFERVIRGPYHRWTYEFDGQLRSAPHLDPADTAGRRLHPIAVDEWGGFTFVNQRPDPPSLTDQLGGTVDRLANYPLSQMQRGAQVVYEVAANWKVLCENYNECYHCGPVHPELCELVPSFRIGGGAQLDWTRGIPHRPGADSFTATGTTPRRSFAGLDADELVNHKGELVYPNLCVSLSRDHVAAFTLWPTGPAATTVVCDFLFDPAEIERADFDPSDAVDFWDTVNRQDWAICERVQRGMTSRHFTHGWYAPMEDASLDIRTWWHEQMGAS